MKHSPYILSYYTICLSSYNVTIILRYTLPYMTFKGIWSVIARSYRDMISQISGLSAFLINVKHFSLNRGDKKDKKKQLIWFIPYH